MAAASRRATYVQGPQDGPLPAGLRKIESFRKPELQETWVLVEQIEGSRSPLCDLPAAAPGKPPWHFPSLAALEAFVWGKAD